LIAGALGSLICLAGCGAGTPDASAARTRAQNLRVADASPEAVAHMKEMVRPFVSRDPGNVRVVREANGAVRREFTAGFQNVVILHRGADGKNSVSCVDSVDGVAAAMTSPRPSEVR
jgi:hypothetical protein